MCKIECEGLNRRVPERCRMNPGLNRRRQTVRLVVQLLLLILRFPSQVLLNDPPPSSPHDLHAHKQLSQTGRVQKYQCAPIDLSHYRQYSQLASSTSWEGGGGGEITLIMDGAITDLEAVFPVSLALETRT